MGGCDQFPFFALPQELQLEVLRKMKVKDVLAVRLSCSAMNNLIELHRLSLPHRTFHYVELHPVMDDETHITYDEETFVRLFKNGKIRGLTISYMEVTDEFVKSMERAFRKHRILVQRLGLDYCRISADPSLFVRLLDTMKISELSIINTITVNERFAHDLTETATVKRLERFGVLLPTEICDNYLADCRNEWLAVVGTNITATAVNQFVTEWIEGRRSFQYLALEFPEPVDLAEILYNVDFNIENQRIMIRNKCGEERKVTVFDKYIQIYSDKAIKQKK
ncbi:hypothetical protein RB195_003429 [Necator americanus]|uniref:F-box domain-containing protein n=1 Tax=Necator americanus TaxID=51031 RepID=A0ABR1DNH8_NECAM